MGRCGGKSESHLNFLSLMRCYFRVFLSESRDKRVDVSSETPVTSLAMGDGETLHCAGVFMSTLHCAGVFMSTLRLNR